MFLAFKRAPIGRREIASKLGLGEGVVRGLINRGKEMGHIEVSKTGSRITQAGMAYLKTFLKMCGIVNYYVINHSPICGNICVIYLLSIRPIEDVVRLRDEIVRFGACGALIAIKEAGKLVLPPINVTLNEIDEQIWGIIRDAVNDVDTVVVACSEDLANALRTVNAVCKAPKSKVQA